MKKYKTLITAIIIGTIAVHFTLVKAAPFLVMDLIIHGLKKMGVEKNTLYHAKPATWRNRTIVKPSPDLLYSVAYYDISKNPLKIKAKVPATYWSLSLFQSNLDNYFVINDEQIKTGEANIIIVLKGKTIKGKGSDLVIESPSSKGLILFRTLIEDKSKINDLIKNQRMAALMKLNY